MNIQSIRRTSIALGLIAALGALLASPVSAADETRIPGHYIVVFEDSVRGPAVVAENQTEQRGGELGLVYRHAIKGYSAELSKDAVQALRSDPRVRFVAPDRRVEAFAQTIPTGIERVFATENAAIDIDGTDDARVDADVAVIDTGIDFEHPDLNVVGRTNCVPPKGTEEPSAEECLDGTGTDDHFHGTHVAGTIGAIDNGQGVVGVAPGARLWAVKVLMPGFLGGATGTQSWVVAGVDWVTATHGDENPENDIEVANMSLGCVCSQPALEAAISASVEEGIVYVVAAGNESIDVKHASPARNPDVITVSALADFDGAPNGEATHVFDDLFAPFSNFGSGVDVAAPGVAILSTIPSGEYDTVNGTSMASPHVAGAAAIHAEKASPEDRQDVEAIRQELIDEGSLDWKNTAQDGKPEPLLYLGGTPLASEAAVDGAASVDTDSATIAAAANGRGLGTKYHLQYGKTTSYGTVVPVPSKELAPGTAYGTHSQPIAGLEEGTTYHYRAVASNEGGTVASNDRRFTTHEAPPSFGFSLGSQGTGDGQFEEPVDVTTDSAGNLYVVDRALDRVQKFDPEGKLLLKFGSQGTGNGQFLGPEGLAVDSGGNIWVSDRSTSRVQKFNPQGEYLSQFGSPGEGNGQFSAPVGMAIDAEGNLWVVDDNENRIQKFNTKGEYLDQFGSEGFDQGEFQNPKDIAIDPQGNLWVTDYGNARIQKFDPQGNFLTRAGGPGEEIGQFGFESVSGIDADSEGNVYVVDGSEGRIQKFNTHGEYLTSFSAVSPVGIDVDQSGGVWAVDWPVVVKKWNPRPPTVTTKAASGAAEDAATLHATVDPNGGSTAYQFEYGTTTAYGSKAPLSPKSIGSGSKPVAVEEAIGGLKPSTTYHFRIVATNATGAKSLGEDLQFTTPQKPVVTTKAATGVKSGRATLNASVNPKGFATTYQFEYGTTTAYGSKAPASPKSVGSGTSAVEVKEELNLQPTETTTYHFRVAATNEAGTSYGEDKTFTVNVYGFKSLYETSGVQVESLLPAQGAIRFGTYSQDCDPPFFSASTEQAQQATLTTEYTQGMACAKSNMDMDGCQLTFEPEEPGPEGTFVGALSLGPAECGPITAEIHGLGAGCEALIDPHNGFKAAVSYKNGSEGLSEIAMDATFSFTVGGLPYCGGGSTKYSGTWEAEWEVGLAEPLFVSELVDE